MPGTTSMFRYIYTDNKTSTLQKTCLYIRCTYQKVLSHCIAGITLLRVAFPKKLYNVLHENPCLRSSFINTLKKHVT